MSLKRAKKTNVFFLVLDKNFKHHPGLADRLKAIVSCYYIAKSSGYEFKLVDQTNCGIADFIVSPDSDLMATSSDLEYSAQDTRFMYFSAALCGLEYRLPPNKQVHCYAYQGDDIFFHNGGDYINNFRNLFNELFTPSEWLRQLVDETGLKTKEYVAVHARFVNSLGAFESTRYPTLSPDKQEMLIKRCLAAIENVCRREKKKVVLFSDSKRFLDRAKILPVEILNSDDIAHISLNNNKNVLAKTFLDFWLIKQSAKTYRLSSNESELHLTNFSYYAAFAGGSEVHDIKV